MVTVILAEKETQAAAYAESLGTASKKGKVHMIKQTPYFSDEVHVIALNMAYRRTIGIWENCLWSMYRLNKH